MNLGLKTNEMEKRIDRKKSTSPMKWILRDIRSPHSEVCCTLTGKSWTNCRRYALQLILIYKTMRCAPLQWNTGHRFQSEIDQICAVCERLQCEVLHQEHSVYNTLYIYIYILKWNAWWKKTRIGICLAVHAVQKGEPDAYTERIKRVE